MRTRMGSSTATSTPIKAFWHGPTLPAPGGHGISGGGRRAQDRCRPGGRPTDAQPLPRTPIRRQPAGMRRATEACGRLPAPRRPSGIRLLGEIRQRRSRGAVLVQHRRDPRGPRPTIQGRANQRCTPATVTLLVLLLGPVLMTAWPAGGARGPYLSTTTLKASVGRKPQQPVISPAKKIRPDRCGAATRRLVAANAPTASNQSTSWMGGGCKAQWTPRPRRCRPVG
jgi:hypothetical protein